MAQTLTEERRVAWRIQGIGPDPAHTLVIFRKVGQGKILHQILRPGEVFKRPFFTPADSFETYAVSADGNLRHEFSRKYQAGAQTWTFTLHVKLHIRVGSAERLGLSLSDQDPLERLQEEAANVLSATARRFSWDDMKQEGEDFGLRLRESETTDGQGERRTNFQRLQSFAGDLGFELRHLDVLRSLTEPDLEDEKRARENERRKAIARSDQGLATEREKLNHEIQSLRDHLRLERETSVARSSQALQGMQRLRLVLDAITREGIRGISQSVDDLHSFAAIHDALNEIQGIQASLAVMSGGPALTLASGAEKGGAEGSAPGPVLELTARRSSPLESIVAQAFRHLRPLDENPQDQRRILASVLHLVAEAGLGADADTEFLTAFRDELAGRLQPLQAALEKEPRDFLSSILDLEGLRQRLA
jgi:hypothetical protein